MRIVISDSGKDWRGTESVTWTLAHGFRDRGHDVIVFVRPGSMLLERLSAAGFTCEAILEGGDLSPMVLARCRRALRRHQPDVVITQKDKDVRWTGFVARTLGIPVLIRHATDRPLKNKLHYRLFYRWVPQIHVANSASTKQTLLESAPWLGNPTVHIVHNGIDVERFWRAAKADLGLPSNAVVIGFAGHFETRKGIFDFAPAWRRVSEAVPDAHAIIVGSGSREAEFKAALQDVPRTHWLGFRNDIASIFKSMDVFVMPSHFEGFGLVLAEAMATGTACITYNASNLPELVDDGVNGVLVPVGDVDALTRAMLDLATDAERRRALGDAAHATAAERFSSERMVAQYEEIIKASAGQATS